jgi:hypothetical protein
MTIRANVARAAAKITAEREEDDKPFTKEIKAKALKAILGGSKEWVAYMQIFADTPEQLARLVPTDNTDNDAMNDARAYLIAAGPCTPDTVANMENSVTDILDFGM